MRYLDFIRSRPFLRIAFLGLLIAAGVASFAADGWGESLRAVCVGKPAARAASLLNTIGDWGFLATVAAGGWFAASLLDRRRAARILLAMLVSTTLAGGVANVWRAATGRARPSARLNSEFYGPIHEGRWIAGKHKFAAFPSAHTSCTTGFVGAALFASPSLGVFLVPLAVGVSWARIYAHAHHVSDVVVAWLVGLGCAYRVWRSRRFFTWSETLFDGFPRRSIANFFSQPAASESVTSEEG